MRNKVALVIALSLCWHPTNLQSATNDAEKHRWDDWKNVSALRPGQQVRVEPHKGSGKKITGQFVASDEGGITVRNKRGIETVSRPSVRRISAVRVGREHHVVAGGVIMAIGGAIILGLNIRQRQKPVWEKETWKDAAPALTGLGIGVFGGVLMVKGGLKRVYEVPPPTQPVTGSPRASVSAAGSQDRGR